jgi:oligoendopeptidase F
VGFVDEKMTEIKGSIDDILRQSVELKKSNDALEREINEKEHILREKEEDLSRLKD